MSALRSASVLLVLVFVTGTSAPRMKPPTDPCDREHDIPLSIDPDLKLRVVRHSLTFHPYVEGDLTLQNETGALLKGTTLLVNYEDARGHPIFTITYETSVKGSEWASSYARTYRNVLTRPVQPGEVFSLYQMQLLATTAIPARTEVPLAYIQQADMNHFYQVGGSGWRSDPILERVPAGNPELGVPPLDLPDDVLLKLSLGPRGSVEHVDLASDAVSSDPLVTLAMDEIRRWHFFPAVLNGYAVSSDFRLLLQFRRSDVPPPRDCFIGQADKYPKTFTLVTLETNPKPPGGWEWFYGGYDVYGWNGPFLTHVEMEETPWKINDP